MTNENALILEEKLKLNRSNKIDTVLIAKLESSTLIRLLTTKHKAIQLSFFNFIFLYYKANL